MTASELIVVIVRDGGLRSALIARLSLQGESLVTLDVDPEDPYIQRVAPAPRILLIEKALLGDRLEALVAGSLWRGIMVVDEEAQDLAVADPVSVVRRGQALADVAATLERWRG